ncbi:conserved hypothetical protein [Ricinus communis]|uniref:Uncharacterized protein n=1 Tax=Ricinus communis TaxID=3988 RepID=B9SPN7_RICCO|nr:conserved hypothetical protein [Ricinus communis]
MEVWFLSYVGYSPNSIGFGSIKDWWKVFTIFLLKNQDNVVERVMNIVWPIWKMHNEIIFNKQDSQSKGNEVATRVTAYFSKFRYAPEFFIKHGIKSPLESFAPLWIAPGREALKVNMETSFNLTSWDVGIVVVVRD